jgi:hypothetical protein
MRFSSQYLRFLLPIIPPTVPRSSYIIGDWYNEPNLADIPSGLSLTPYQNIKKELPRGLRLEPRGPQIRYLHETFN